MYKHLHPTLLAASIVATASALYAQNVEFQIEKGILNVPSTLGQTFVYGGTFDGSYTPETLQTAVNSILNQAIADPNQAATQLSSLLAADSFSNWGQVNPAPIIFEDEFDWLSSLSGTSGSIIYLLVLSTDINAISSNTRAGILLADGASVPLPPSPTMPIGFTGQYSAYTWDHAIMGSFNGSGGYDLQSIPEPATYALLLTAIIAAGAIARRSGR